MDAAAHIIPVLFDGKLKGKADSVITNFEQVFSDIGNFSPRCSEFSQLIWNYFLIFTEKNLYTKNKLNDCP
jgi:hypothetical protein